MWQKGDYPNLLNTQDSTGCDQVKILSVEFKKEVCQWVFCKSFVPAGWPHVSANPGNTGGKFKSSSMKHLINILNVFLAIDASRAMGSFGVLLIFLRRILESRARVVGFCTGWLVGRWEGGKLEGDGERRLFPHQAPSAGTLIPCTHATLASG